MGRLQQKAPLLIKSKGDATAFPLKRLSFHETGGYNEGWPQAEAQEPA